MVKLDPKRNYYADLEVAPDADADEIRKQFRKLALKWHPDRNPGKEGECVPRFQAIQAAHEILGDPVERQKYDVERRKRGFYATQRQPAPRGNPYQATSNFPPPPRRTGRAQPPPRADYASTAGTASSGANRFTNFPRPPPTAQRKDNAAEAKANVFNAWQNMKTKQNASSHAHTQSDATGRMPKSAWEAANEGKPGVNRSQSTRASKRPGFDPATPGADEPPAASTSAYFRTSNYGRPVPPPPPPPRDANAPGAPGQPVDPMRQFRETLQKDVPFSEGSRIRTPYGSSGGERTFIDPVRRSASQRSSPHRAPGSADPTGAFRPGGPTARHHSSSPPRRKGNATRPFSLYPSSDEEDMAEPTRPSQPQANAQSGAGMNGFSNQNFYTESNANNASGGMGQKSKSSIFNFPIDSDTFAQTPDQAKAKSKSAEGINTKFSPGDWHGKFEGKPDYFSGPINPSNGRSRKSPNRPPSAAKNRTPNAAFGAPPMPTPPADQPAASPSPTAGGATAANTGPFKFSQEEWLESLKDPSFIFPTKPPKSTSPTKGPAPMRGRKQSRSRTTTSSSTKPKPASVADADEESNESASSANEAATADSPMAMDIDPEPSQPATNGTTHRPKIVPTSISQARAAQREQAKAQAQSQAQGTGVEGASIRLDDLRNVAPFTTSQEGLKNLNDLTQNLPFDSRASTAHPTRSSEPSLLRLPELPKAPELPQRLTMSAWQELLPKMATYVRAFHQFDSHMLQHFAARQHETDAMGTPANWLGAIGDTTAGGFGSYMRGIKEDERARMHWKVGWEWHRTAMELFEGCRARVLKGNLAP